MIKKGIIKKRIINKVISKKTNNHNKNLKLE